MRATPDQARHLGTAIFGSSFDVRPFDTIRSRPVIVSQKRMGSGILYSVDEGPVMPVICRPSEPFVPGARPKTARRYGDPLGHAHLSESAVGNRSLESIRDGKRFDDGSPGALLRVESRRPARMDGAVSIRPSDGVELAVGSLGDLDALQPRRCRPLLDGCRCRR